MGKTESEQKKIAGSAPEMQNRLKCADVLEKQLELLLRASEFCEKSGNFFQYIPALTHAMVEISQVLCAGGT